MHTCFICGKFAETEEHIIPKWLQNKFDLWNQRIVLPNKTTITYKQLKIPCCVDCNGTILSSIESKIKDGTASDKDIWQWGAKIHFGLVRKDDFLEWDRKNPGYKIGQVIKADDPLEIDRHLIHSIHGEFITHPNPFGSVYKFNFKNEENYHFAHLIQPAGVCVCTGKVGYVIFVRDGGSLSRQPSVQHSYTKHLDNCHLGKLLNFFANSWVHLYRHKVSHPFMMTRNSITILGAGKLIQEIPFTDEMFQELWRYITDNPDAPIVSPDVYDASNGIV